MRASSEALFTSFDGTVGPYKRCCCLMPTTRTEVEETSAFPTQDLLLSQSTHQAPEVDSSSSCLEGVGASSPIVKLAFSTERLEGHNSLFQASTLLVVCSVLRRRGTKLEPASHMPWLHGATLTKAWNRTPICCLLIQMSCS